MKIFWGSAACMYIFFLREKSDSNQWEKFVSFLLLGMLFMFSCTPSPAFNPILSLKSSYAVLLLGFFFLKPISLCLPLCAYIDEMYGGG